MYSSSVLLVHDAYCHERERKYAAILDEIPRDRPEQQMYRLCQRTATNDCVQFIRSLADSFHVLTDIFPLM